MPTTKNTTSTNTTTQAGQIVTTPKLIASSISETAKINPPTGENSKPTTMIGRTGQLKAWKNNKIYNEKRKEQTRLAIESHEAGTVYSVNKLIKSNIPDDFDTTGNLVNNAIAGAGGYGAAKAANTSGGVGAVKGIIAANVVQFLLGYVEGRLIHDTLIKEEFSILSTYTE